MELFKHKITITTLVLAITILLYPLVAVFSPKGMVLLLVLPALIFLLIEGNRTAVIGALPRVFLTLLAALMAWSLVTIWWSPMPLDGLELWFRVVGIGLCGVVMIGTAAKSPTSDRRFLAAAFIASGWIFVALFAFELLTEGNLSRLTVSLWNLLTPWDTVPPTPALLLLQSSAGLAVFAWPCMLAIRQRGSTTIAVLFASAVGALLLTQNMEASLVAFSCGIAVYAMVYMNRSWGIAGFVAGLLLVNLALVFFAFEFVLLEQPEGISAFISESSKERLYIIDYVYEKINQNLFFGWGFDGSRAIGQDTLGGFGVNKSIPLHPHNLWAQTWLELGVVGLVLVISLVAAVALRLAASGRGRVAVSAAAAALASYLLIGNISYGMWQNWWLAIAWLNAGFLAVNMISEGGADDP